MGIRRTGKTGRMTIIGSTGKTGKTRIIGNIGKMTITGIIGKTTITGKTMIIGSTGRTIMEKEPIFGAYLWQTISAKKPNGFSQIMKMVLLKAGKKLVITVLSKTVNRIVVMVKLVDVIICIHMTLLIMKVVTDSCMAIYEKSSNAKL